MYLFSQNKNKIDVYEVVADTDKLKQYRKKILDTYQEDELFYMSVRVSFRNRHLL